MFEFRFLKLHSKFLYEFPLVSCNCPRLAKGNSHWRKLEDAMGGDSFPIVTGPA